MHSAFLAAAAVSVVVAMSVPAAAEPPVFGYVGLYVKDVPRSVAFYEQAFGLTRRHVTQQQEYGEMQTGTTRLGFINLALIEQMTKAPSSTRTNAPPSGSEIGFVTPDVDGLYKRAVAAGAVPVEAPAEKPWHQIVSYVRDPDGHLVEICSPLP
jgi:catechol 2,3-dioxygenase-like lactoylglutathione lyase family enzyme